MAVNVNPVAKFGSDPMLSRSMQFRRKKEKTQSRKKLRNKKIDARHIILYFLVFVGFFIAFQQAYLFLITWDKLTINQVEVICGKPELQTAAADFLEGRYLGNILLLDISRLREALESHRWVEIVRVRNIFPATLKITISERIPAAIISKKQLLLIDRNGIELDPVPNREYATLPLFTDRNFFQNYPEVKLESAWACLDDLTPTLREQVDIIDLTEYENVQIRFKNSQHLLKLGQSNFAEKIRLYQSELPYLEQLGPLEYVDLRIPGRTIIKPQKIMAGGYRSNHVKEAK